MKSSAIIEITVYYILAFAVGVLSLLFVSFDNIIVDFLVADLFMTIFIFACSLIKKNSSVYDAYWSVIPFYFLIGFAVLLRLYSWDFILVFVIVSAWSWRLTQSWARGWNGFSHEDYRYVDLAKKTKKWYPIVNFLGIHLFPTLIVFAACLPLFHLVQSELQFLPLLCLGALISITGIYLEFIADIELARFRKRKNPQLGDILNTGIWSRSRNPNYLGEMLFWIGIATIGFAYNMPYFYASGAIALIAMFLFISIPMKDKRMSSRRIGYDAYKKNVPLLLPKWFK